ncbi:hypothetical protein CO178_02050 [candidate division WWE3 bacterium CG_4_9_14_3_um_filter_34_6]|uniref:Four helix bundle protein n=1 Tax=candidate division WWE3 bacterium CG_4_9_14_3_um_filter_34_6 TaxID=1975079 RepID=A0A2M7X3H6_UNCKA|nr:MAG: hypothetical protein CO178_02050 [candidate division WWE3 bacterium CG_4_9_14_3_um_filter_34_6]
MNYQYGSKSYGNRKSFSPKRPVKSFLDLEVYQKSLAICVAVVKRVVGQDELHEHVIAIPRLIASAHSLRFSDHDKSIAILENCMLKCNLAVVYLEQYRDMYNKDIEIEFFEEQVKSLLTLRNKIMRLQMSWKKFRENKNEV